MIICRMCAHANDLDAKPVEGVYECENCKGAGVNTGYEVEGMSPEQVAKAEAAAETFTDRVLGKAVSLMKRGLREEPPS